MAKIIFKIEPTTQMMTQLINGTKKHGSLQLASRVLAKAALISNDIGTMLTQTFNNTEVAQALRGNGSIDLPAHLGLDDATANSLADGMVHLIRSSIHVLTRSINKVTSIRIQAVSKNWTEYLSLPGASYVSHPSELIIPVARWLLINPNIDIGQAAYDIVFRGEGTQFDARIQRVSRSGRAIMVSLDSLGGSGGYVLPSIISGGFGENFIEYSLGQPGVAEKAAQLLMKRVI